MNTYFMLYVLFKLDDMRYFLDNDYGWTLLIGGGLFVSYAIITRDSDSDGTIIPFGNLFRDSKKDEYSNQLKKFIKIFLCVWIMQFMLNFIAFSLPSTGQAVAIIMGGKGAESQTFKVLMSADPKIANYLKHQLDEFLIIENKGKN